LAHAPGEARTRKIRHNKGAHCEAEHRERLIYLLRLRAFFDHEFALPTIGCVEAIADEAEPIARQGQLAER
jgi:hypothetical protein